ncbi:MAG: response regulator [Opitutaceae bacterium]|nr:response regulator [Opitutaceae bacterium]
MEGPRKFLVVDDNVDGRSLLVRTLRRKFPHASVTECRDATEALRIAATERLDAIVTHRAWEVDGLTLIRELRQANPSVPIVMVSGIDRSEPARAAGATSFLNYDEWLRLGAVVADIIGPR